MYECTDWMCTGGRQQDLRGHANTRSLQIYKYSRRRGAICPGHLPSPQGLPDCNPITSHTLLPSHLPFSLSSFSALFFSFFILLFVPFNKNSPSSLRPSSSPSSWQTSSVVIESRAILRDRVTTASTVGFRFLKRGCLGVHVILDRGDEITRSW